MDKYDEFLNPLCVPSKVELYTVRFSLLKAVKENISLFRGKLLDVGCGQMPYKSLILSNNPGVTEYIGLDIGEYFGSKPDLFWDGETIPLSDESVDCAMATELLEHCPNPAKVLSEIYRVLRPEGLLFFTVPFIWPLHLVPNDEYQYTPFSLRRLLAQAGFRDISIKALGGWDVSLAQMLSIWVRYRPMRYRYRVILAYALTPVVKLLSVLDKKPSSFTDNTMANGWYGVARKLSHS
ncbi:MAG: class I SAM-dependent methyltransferase [Chloroherpetonaceae bacterium]|nr:class I SAM-dependent methyltransferase [Chloroherpetonaceae bacterium]